jgi:hypothetical protein
MAASAAGFRLRLHLSRSPGADRSQFAPKANPIHSPIDLLVPAEGVEAKKTFCLGKSSQYGVPRLAGFPAEV